MTGPIVFSSKALPAVLAVIGIDHGSVPIFESVVLAVLKVLLVTALEQHGRLRAADARMVVGELTVDGRRVWGLIAG